MMMMKLPDDSCFRTILTTLSAECVKMYCKKMGNTAMLKKIKSVCCV